MSYRDIRKKYLKETPCRYAERMSGQQAGNMRRSGSVFFDYNINRKENKAFK